MTRLRQLICVVIAIGSTACVPMEQASLTYTSKTTMGVGVAAGSQDAPGLDVAIGFKEVNVALVPVAVAKYCYKATAAQCQNAIYKMKPIAGGKLDAVESLPVEKRIAEIDEEVARILIEQKRDTDRLGDLRSRISLSEAADMADADLAKLGPAVTGEAVETQNRRAELMAKANLRAASFDVNKARSEIAQIEASQLARSARVTTLREEQGELSTQLASNSNRRRDDALSVYGKFNGSAGGNGQGANLVAGKVFATGVAAQNLTEFVSITDCLENIGILAKIMPDGNDKAKANLIASAATVCK